MKSFARPFLFVLLIVFMQLPLSVSGAGMYAHSWIGNRVIHNISHKHSELKNLLEEHRYEFICGTFFPDLFYSGKGKITKISDYNHFNRFLNAYRTYWLNKYTTSHDRKSAKAKRELAHYLGAVCHAIADVPWHKDFITTVYKKDFKDKKKKYKDAHIWCDNSLDQIMAGDLFPESQFPKGSPDKLYFPEDLLVELYHAKKEAYKLTGKKIKGYADKMWETHKKEITWSVVNPQLIGFRIASPWGKTPKNYRNGIENAAKISADWLEKIYEDLVARMENKPGAAPFKNLKISGKFPNFVVSFNPPKPPAKAAPAKPTITILPVKPKLPGELTGKLHAKNNAVHTTSIADKTALSSLNPDSDDDGDDDEMFYPEEHNSIKFK